MSLFDDETRVWSAGPDRYDGRVHACYNIGANPNGGYLAAIAGAALRESVPQHPDGLSLTVHYLRPGVPDAPCSVATRVVRSGRTLTTAAATLSQEGEARLEVLAALGDLRAPASATPALAPPRPDVPSPDACVGRDGGEQGVTLPILDRVEIRLQVNADFFHHQRVLGHREGVLADGLPIPSRHPGEAVSDVLDLDIQRGGIEKVQPSA